MQQLYCFNHVSTHSFTTSPIVYICDAHWLRGMTYVLLQVVVCFMWEKFLHKGGNKNADFTHTHTHTHTHAKYLVLWLRFTHFVYGALCVCRFNHTHTHTNTYTHTHTHINTHIHTHTHIHIHIYTHHKAIHIRTHTFAHRRSAYQFCIYSVKRHNCERSSRKRRITSLAA